MNPTFTFTHRHDGITVSVQAVYNQVADVYDMWCRVNGKLFDECQSDDVWRDAQSLITDALRTT